MGSPDLSTPANISLRESRIKFIDKYRVGHGFKTRSAYIEYLIDKDIKYRRFDFMAELMSMLVLPMMGFFFFMVLAVLTKGLLFFFFMAIFGMFAVYFSYVYYRKHKIPGGRS